MTVFESGPLAFPNMEAVAAAYLAARPELSGVPVDTEFPADTTKAAVFLSRVGGRYDEDDKVDQVFLRVDTYGPTKTAAHDLACTVRGVLPLIVNAAQSGVQVSWVTEDYGPQWFLDTKHNDSQRYLMRFRLFVHVGEKTS